MNIGLVGRKSGMTRIFTDDGTSIPVTVVEAAPNRITQIKTAQKDGYTAVQVTVGTRKASRIKKPQAGHFAKAAVEAGRKLCELRCTESAIEGIEVGGQVTVEGFSEGQKVDVTGRSRGKGFQGGVKRWNFKTQDATHGNSVSHRAPGSTGQCQTPGKVFKGKKMAGRMGGAQVTAQNLEIVRIDAERGLLLIKGAVPGAPGGDLLVHPTVKARS
ncbi:MAG: 50S ribosomal protein L3 [Cellvibrionales bacterium]|nr:50S ribosomal protein L3 [Cellvibrionales bacterium]